MSKKQELDSLRLIINKLQLLTRLQVTGNVSGEKQQIGCLSETTRTLIEKILQIFKHLKQEQSQKNDNEKQQTAKIRKALANCEQMVKRLQVKIIDTVQLMMKNVNKEENEESCTSEQLYQQFYILCSQYLSNSYDQSNQLCLLLSHQAQGLSTHFKDKQTETLQQKQREQTKQQIKQKKGQKMGHSPDYFLLKHLLEKVYHAKKTFEGERLVLEYEINQLRMKVQEQKIEIINLNNSKDELAEDLSELEEAIEKGLVEKAKKILGKRNLIEKQKDEISKQKQKQKQINCHKTSDTSISQISRQIEQQLSNLHQKNEQLLQQNNTLLKKTQQYKGELYRSAWIISMQNRQINLNLQKLKEYEKKQRSPYNLTNSIVSFNPQKSRAEFVNENYEIRDSIVFENGSIRADKLSTAKKIFEVVSLQPKNGNYWGRDRGA